MSRVEYRIWVTIPQLPLSAESTWEPFIERFEERHGDLGPVLGWEDGTASVVVSTAAADEAEAARVATDATIDVLHVCGLGDHYPSALEVERVEDERDQVPA